MGCMDWMYCVAMFVSNKTSITSITNGKQTHFQHTNHSNHNKSSKRIRNSMIYPNNQLKTTNGCANASQNDLLKHRKTMIPVKSILKLKQTEFLSNNISNNKQLENELIIDNKRKSLVQFEKQVTIDNSKIHINEKSEKTIPTMYSTSNLTKERQLSLSIHVDYNECPRINQRISDLRKMLSSEVEKEDSIKRLIHCNCFEFNLNNAAKIITLIVLLATIILIIKSLTKNLL